jgi:hypothetical protein
MEDTPTQRENISRYPLMKKCNKGKERGGGGKRRKAKKRLN